MQGAYARRADCLSDGPTLRLLLRLPLLPLVLFTHIPCLYCISGIQTNDAVGAYARRAHRFSNGARLRLLFCLPVHSLVPPIHTTCLYCNSGIQIDDAVGAYPRRAYRFSNGARLLGVVCSFVGLLTPCPILPVNPPPPALPVLSRIRSTNSPPSWCVRSIVELVASLMALPSGFSFACRFSLWFCSHT